MRKVYQCEHTVPPVWWFTFADRNALGEEIIVEFRKNENTHGKHSLHLRISVVRSGSAGMWQFKKMCRRKLRADRRNHGE